MEQVEAADHMQLGRWYRFFPSPGNSAIGTNHKHFQKVLARESLVLDRIIERFNEKGGMSPRISKTIGW